MTFFTGKVFALRLANPLIGGRGLYKRKRTLWYEMLCTKSKSVDSEPTRPPSLVGLIFFLNKPISANTIEIASPLRNLCRVKRPLDRYK